MNKEEQCQQQAKVYKATRGSATRGEERNTVLQVRKQRQLDKFAQDDSNVIINTDQKGKLSQSEAEYFRDEDEADQSKIETVWFG